jgi:hypothetical protein
VAHSSFPRPFSYPSFRDKGGGARDEYLEKSSATLAKRPLERKPVYYHNNNIDLKRQIDIQNSRLSFNKIVQVIEYFKHFQKNWKFLVFQGDRLID